MTLASAIGEQLLKEALAYPVVLEGINALEADHPVLTSNRARHLLADPDAELAMLIFEQAASMLLAPLVEEKPLDVYESLHRLSRLPGFRTHMTDVLMDNVAATAFLLEFMTVENNYFLSIAEQDADEILHLNGAPFVRRDWAYDEARLESLRMKWYNRPQ